uniref:Selenoprotein F/M domain-containing protein n=1 Tax=Hemiselmis andersenii TaxID=464988 RepID=A0A7S1EGF3_HEMAN
MGLLQSRRRFWGIILAVTLLVCLSVEGVWSAKSKKSTTADGTGPTCSGEQCKRVSSVQLLGLDVENFPQVRIFMEESFPSYPSITRVRVRARHPTFAFLDDTGEKIEEIDIGGMFREEMEEELQARGIVKQTRVQR